MTIKERKTTWQIFKGRGRLPRERIEKTQIIIRTEQKIFTRQWQNMRTERKLRPNQGL